MSQLSLAGGGAVATKMKQIGDKVVVKELLKKGKRPLCKFFESELHSVDSRIVRWR